MTLKLSPALRWVGLAAVLAFVAVPASVQAADLKLEAHLLWGTDDNQPPQGKTYKPVDPDIRKKLKELPLKWSNYFEVNRQGFDVGDAGAKKVALSEKCQLDVKNAGNSTLEVSLIGKGKEVMKRTQALPKGDILVLGGNAPNATAWLVVLKRLE